MAWSSAGVALVALIGLGASRRGEIGVVESATTAVSEVDLQGIVRAYAAEVADVPAVLVLVTSFDDVGAGGPAYFVAIASETSGTGLGSIDRRAAFGARSLEAVVNLRRIADHGDVVAALTHELAHRHLAYLRAETATTSYDLTGRDHAHWHAALQAEGSLLDGHAWREAAPGRFVVEARAVRFSTLDLYALGLLPPEEVRPFFLILGARTEGGAPLPPGAQLAIGAVALGERRDLTIDDVIRAEGPRARERELRAVFALVTAPGEEVREEDVAAVDALRGEAARGWAAYTGGRGMLCTTIAPCTPSAPDAGVTRDATNDDAGPDEPEPAPKSCSCRATGASPGAAASYLAILVWVTRRRRGPSCDRSPPRDGRRRRGACRPPR